MLNPLVSKAVVLFFNKLNKLGARYAVLRKAEKIPDDIGNDIDIVLGTGEESRVREAVRSCADAFGFKIYERRDVKGFYPILYTFVDEKVIFFRLDFTNPVGDPEALLHARVQNEKGIYYLPPGLYKKKPKSRFKNFLTFPLRFLFPPGRFTVIVGPDGVGKSTTAELMAQLLEAFHIPVAHMHLGFRPRILPTRKGFTSLGKEEPAPGEKSKTPGLLRFLYHTLDYFLGYLVKIRPLLMKGRFVIGERYYYNYLVDPRPKKELGFPEWLPRALYFFMPKPDTIILLSNNPEKIFERRQEHAVGEIERQTKVYRERGARARNFFEIETNKPPHEVALEALGKLGIFRKKYRLAVVASHPIQYQSPLWREIAKHPDIDITVYYCVDWGVSKPQLHKDFFNVPYKWDVPLLEGYTYKFLRNYSPKPGPYLGGFINPGIFGELWRNKYDAVLVMGWMDVTFWFAFLAAKLKGIPVLLRTVNSLSYDRAVRRSRLLLFLKHGYLTVLFRRFVSAFLAIGTWNRNMYLNYGVSPERIFHFPYAVNNTFFFEETKKHAPRRDEIRNELDINPKAKVITYAARFVAEKHPEHILLAYEKMRDIPGVTLLMVGDGPLRAVLEKEAKEKKLTGMKFLGFKNQTELVKIYAISDIFVRTDGYHKGDWGATVNEALACGLPVICTDAISSQADLIRQGEDGFVYALGDIDAFAGFMKKMVLEPELLSSMKRKSIDIISGWGYERDIDGLIKALGYVSKNQ